MDPILAPKPVVAGLAFCRPEYQNDADYCWGAFVMVSVIF